MVRKSGEASSMCFFQEVKSTMATRVEKHALTVQEGDKHCVLREPRLP